MPSKTGIFSPVRLGVVGVLIVGGGIYFWLGGGTFGESRLQGTVTGPSGESASSAQQTTSSSAVVSPAVAGAGSGVGAASGANAGRGGVSASGGDIRKSQTGSARGSLADPSSATSGGVGTGAATADAALKVLGAAQPPTADSVHDEVARDPESPSRAVRVFSIELEKKMGSALESEDSAASVFSGLETCATDGGSHHLAESARVICLSNADRLAKKYPVLRPRYENLESRVDQHVVQLKKMMDLQ